MEEYFMTRKFFDRLEVGGRTLAIPPPSPNPIPRRHSLFLFVAAELDCSMS